MAYYNSETSLHNCVIDNTTLVRAKNQKDLFCVNAGEAEQGRQRGQLPPQICTACTVSQILLTFTSINVCPLNGMPREPPL